MSNMLVILRGMMNTDIKESDQDYELDIDLPGAHKESLAAEMKDGCLCMFIPKVSQVVQMEQKNLIAIEG